LAALSPRLGALAATHVTKAGCQGITAATARYNRGMEADQINTLNNSLQDLAARAAEIRRYL
jgi:hypothetical protein